MGAGVRGRQGNFEGKGDAGEKFAKILGFAAIPHLRLPREVSTGGTRGAALGSCGAPTKPHPLPDPSPLPSLPAPPTHPHTHKSSTAKAPRPPIILTTNRFLSSTSCRFRRISDFKTSISLPGFTPRASLSGSLDQASTSQGPRTHHKQAQIPDNGYQ